MITILQEPTGVPSVNSPMWFVVDSDNKNTAGFQYVFDIYKDGNLITRLKNVPYGSDKYGIIDVSTIVRGFVTDELVSAVSTNTLSFVNTKTDAVFSDFDVRFGEVSGGVTTENDASGTYTGWNRYNRSLIENKNTDNIDSSGVWFTNRPQTSFFYEGQPIVMGAKLADANYKLVINSVDKNLETTDTEYNGYKLLYYNDITQTESFILNIKRVSNSQLQFDNRTFEKRCSKYQPFTLVFLNAWGLLDSFTFCHGKVTIENEKKSFQTSEWKLTSGIMQNINSGYNESKKVYAVNNTTKMKLFSDILSTEEYEWLSELISSPLVYLYARPEVVIPCVITNSNYELKNSLINKTEILELDIEFGNMTNSQFR